MLESLNWDLNLGTFKHLENLREGATFGKVAGFNLYTY